MAMYLRVTPFRFDTARELEAVRYAETQVIPACRRLPGFRHYVGSVDRATGRGVLVSLWDEQPSGVEEMLAPLGPGIMAVGIQVEDAQAYEVVTSV